MATKPFKGQIYITFNLQFGLTSLSPNSNNRKWLWNHLTWCGSNKMLSLSLKWLHHVSIAVAFVCQWFSFGSHLGNFPFGRKVCTLQFMGPLFLYFFQKFSKFRFRVYLLHLLCFYQACCTLIVCYCHITGGCWI